MKIKKWLKAAVARKWMEKEKSEKVNLIEQIHLIVTLKSIIQREKHEYFWNFAWLFVPLQPK